MPQFQVKLEIIYIEGVPFDYFPSDDLVVKIPELSLNKKDQKFDESENETSIRRPSEKFDELVIETASEMTNIAPGDLHGLIEDWLDCSYADDHSPQEDCLDEVDNLVTEIANGDVPEQINQDEDALVNTPVAIEEIMEHEDIDYFTMENGFSWEKMFADGEYLPRMNGQRDTPEDDNSLFGIY